MFGGTGRAGAYQSVGFGATSDAVYLPAFAGGDGTLHLTEAWGVRGAFNHNWDPYWSTSLFGSYAAVRYDGTAKADIVRQGSIAAARATGWPVRDYSCNPDFNISQLGVVTRWTPVKNLTFSAEVSGSTSTRSSRALRSLTAAGSEAGGAVYEFKDQDTCSLHVRAQRNF